MKSTLRMVAALVGVCSVLSFAAPEVSFSGYLDADVWGDLTGSYYTNSELDLGMSLKFSEKVAAHFYATVWSANGENPGSIPAGVAPPDERWLSVLFDGFDVTFDSKIGTFAVGDLVYQFGKFNYYFYKRLSMITSESFTRGLSYSFGGDMVKQQFLLGIADKNSSTADIQSVTSLALSDVHSLGIYLGLQNDATSQSLVEGDFYAGFEYLGAIGDVVSLKFDLGFRSLAGEERTNVTSILFEPSLSLGDFSLAFTGFVSVDGDDNVNSATEQFKLGDEMFFYLEPGYSFTDMFAFGLPLEYHAADMANEDDDAIWVVPTFYIYPFENVEWWLWGQLVAPTAEDSDLGYGIGSEIIVNF